MSDSFVGVPEAADILGVSQATVRRWADSGKIPMEKTDGGHRRFTQESIQLAAKQTTITDPVMLAGPPSPDAVAPKPPPTYIGEELGVGNVLPVGDFDSYYGASGMDGEILRSGLVPIDDLVLMRRRDGHARALMRLLTLPILKALEGAHWVLPDDIPLSDENQIQPGQDEVDFANAMFFAPSQHGGMTSALPKILRQTLLAFCDGFSAFEEVRTVPKKGPLRGKLVLQKLAYRDSRTIRFHVDDNGGYDGFRQVSYFQGQSYDVRIPADKTWIYTCYGEENPFYGVSLFESAYTHYDIKRKLYYIAHLAAQFAAIPARLGKVPRGADPKEIQAFRVALENFALNTAMMYPSDFEVTMQSSSSTFDFLKLIDHHNLMMSQSVLAGFLDAASRPALVEVGSTASPEADMFVLSLRAVMHEIADSWSRHLMPKYIDWNFDSGIYPVFKFGNLTEDDRSAIQSAFGVVATASILNATPEFVREVEKELAKDLGLNINYAEIEDKEREAASQAQSMAGALPPGEEGAPPPEGEPTPDGAPPAPEGVDVTAEQEAGLEGTEFVEGEVTPPGAPIEEQVTTSMDSLDDLVLAAQALLDREDVPDELYPVDDIMEVTDSGE